MKLRSSFILIFAILILSTLDLMAQCPMCRMAAESNLDHGGTAGQGLNTGILYMLMLPYLLIGIIGYIWYRNRKTDVDYLEEQLNQSSAQ